MLGAVDGITNKGTKLPENRGEGEKEGGLKMEKKKKKRLRLVEDTFFSSSISSIHLP